MLLKKKIKIVGRRLIKEGEPLIIIESVEAKTALELPRAYRQNNPHVAQKLSIRDRAGLNGEGMPVLLGKDKEGNDFHIVVGGLYTIQRYRQVIEVLRQCKSALLKVEKENKEILKSWEVWPKAKIKTEI